MPLGGQPLAGLAGRPPAAQEAENERPQMKT